MINIRRLDQIQLCIPIGKEEEARRFYSGVLGMEEIPKPKELIVNGGLWFQVADIQLHLGTEITIHESKGHSAFEVSDLMEARKWLEDCGIKIKEEIQIPGQSRFSFLDPFANRIDLLQKA
jgi:catechol 2,3-dioxygenase-like lactoylglutathione lyase family enzyme